MYIRIDISKKGEINTGILTIYKIATALNLPMEELLRFNFKES